MTKGDIKQQPLWNTKQEVVWLSKAGTKLLILLHYKAAKNLGNLKMDKPKLCTAQPNLVSDL